MGLDDVFGDIESEAGSVGMETVDILASGELGEKERNFGFRNADAGVFDRDFDFPFRPRLHRNRDASFLGILDGVVNQIGEDFLHLLLIKRNDRERLLGKFQFESEFFGAGSDGEGIVKLGKDILDAVVLEFVFHSSSFHAGDVEEILDQIDQTVIGQEDAM